MNNIQINQPVREVVVVRESGQMKLQITQPVAQAIAVKIPGLQGPRGESTIEAQAAAVEAKDARDDARRAKTDSEAARDRAQAWASSPEDVEVDPGEYSAKHWAAKAGANADEIDVVSANIGAVRRVAASADEIDAVASHVANVDTVATDIANVSRVAASADNVDVVAAHVANVDTVADDIAQVNTVAANISSVAAVASNETNINAVAGNAANIDTVANDISDVVAVGSNIADVKKVAAIDADVSTVANLGMKSAATHGAEDFAAAARKITGIGALEGGGDLSKDRTIDLTQEAKDSLAKADSALQPSGNLAGLTDKAAARTNLDLGTSATVDASVTPAAGKIPLGGSAGTIQTVWVQDLSYKLDQYLAQLTALRSPSATPSLYQEWGHGASMLHPDFTFSRATTSTYIENGVLKTAAANVPVFEDGGLRIEPSDTNLIKQSSNLVGSGWGGIAASAGFDSTVRGVDLYKIYSNINGSAARWRNTLTLNPGEYYFSVLLMRGNLDKADVFITVSAPSAAVNSKYGIDFVNKSISNGRLIDLGGGLFKIESKSFSVTATATAYLQLYIGEYNALVSQGDYVFAGAAQISYLERSSYIPTNGSLVTRATDSASITGANFANIYNPASGSLILSGDSYYMRSDIANNVLRLSDQIAIRRDVDGYLYLVRAGQSDLQILSSNQATNNLALACGSNGLDIFVNGAKKHADLAIPGGTIDSLILADSDTAVQNIKRMGIYKQRLTDMLLTGLTS